MRKQEEGEKKEKKEKKDKTKKKDGEDWWRRERWQCLSLSLSRRKTMDVARCEGIVETEREQNYLRVLLAILSEGDFYYSVVIPLSRVG